jgi:hypothetical protein
MIIALREGRIPPASTDQHGRRTTDLETIWQTHCQNYSRKKLAGRLAALRKIVSKEWEPNGFKEPRRWQNSTIQPHLGSWRRTFEKG